MRKRDEICDIVADINEGRIVSPRRIKTLIRTKKSILAGFEKFVVNGGRHADVAQKEAKKLWTEIARYEDILDGAEDIIDILNRAARTCPEEERDLILSMKCEWEAEATGLSWCVRHISPGFVEVK
jgi:hypothetical protein